MEYTLIDVDSILEARKLMAKSSKMIAVLAKDDEFNRKIFENAKVDMVFGLEIGKKKDRLRQRDSGFNQVLAKLAKNNGISIGLDFSLLNRLDDYELSVLLARMSQNIALCKKYKVDMVIVNSKETDISLRAFLLTLGMPTSMVKFTIKNRVSIAFNN